MATPLQVKPGTKDADGDVLHITISVSYLKNRRIENVILSVPYASHVLDVYTTRREDKRSLLQSGYMRVMRLYDGVDPSALEAAEAQAAAAQSAAAAQASSGITQSMG